MIAYNLELRGSNPKNFFDEGCEANDPEMLADHFELLPVGRKSKHNTCYATQSERDRIGV